LFKLAQFEDLIDNKMLAEKLLPAFAGALTFATIRSAYFQYYGRFGLTPEANDIGTARILSDLLIGPALMGLILTVVCVLCHITLSRLARLRGRATRVEPDITVRIAALALSIGMLASGAYLLLLGNSAANRVERAEEPFSSVVLDFKVIRIPLFQVSARHMTGLTTTGSSNSAITDLKLVAAAPGAPIVDRCLLLIGEADGRIYIYHTRTKDVFSLAANSVEYSVDTQRRRLDAACKPSSPQKQESLPR
jgi:hypothetical protein